MFIQSLSFLDSNLQILSYSYWSIIDLALLSIEKSFIASVDRVFFNFYYISYDDII